MCVKQYRRTSIPSRWTKNVFANILLEEINKSTRSALRVLVLSEVEEYSLGLKIMFLLHQELVMIIAKLGLI